MYRWARVDLLLSFLPINLHLQPSSLVCAKKERPIFHQLLSTYVNCLPGSERTGFSLSFPSTGFKPLVLQTWAKEEEHAFLSLAPTLQPIILSTYVQL
ncbi:MAG: hypothetical protein BYD32DRAFT_232763 [Podila humilis]|nr:MAG: hypothetical protein BYD32DRAFT_232763 [Podila humilis]